MRPKYLLLGHELLRNGPEESQRQILTRNLDLIYFAILLRIA